MDTKFNAEEALRVLYRIAYGLDVDIVITKKEKEKEEEA